MTAAQLDFITASEQRQLHAAQRLQAIVEERRQSFECRDFARRRDAMLKHSRAIGP